MGGDMDGRPISDSYFDGACIVGAPIEEAGPELSANPIVDAAVRMSRSVRILSRLQFVGYEVTGGKSVLIFKRKHPECDHDPWDGIADAIAPDAPPKGWSNAWMLGVNLIAYSPHDYDPEGDSGAGQANPFAPSIFADQYSLWNRCMWFAPEIVHGSEGLSNDALLWHISYGARWSTWGNIISEAPSGWNYAKLDFPYGSNNWLNQHPEVTLDPNKWFFWSCRIYEPDSEVESATTFREHGEDLVAITLKTRLHNTCGQTGGAPQSVSRDMDTWDAATIAAEPFRSTENGLRLYLLHIRDGYNPAPTVGDQSLHSEVHTAINSVFAAIYPTIFMTRLVPKPDPAGTTPMWHDFWPELEITLRAICEGCVDEESTKRLAGCTPDESGNCTDGGHDLYDFSIETLCYAAFGGRWFGTLGTAETSMLQAAETRPDAPQGFGPLPNVYPTAEVFNQFAAAIDQLTKFRVMLPYKLEKRNEYYTGRLELDPDEAFGSCDGTWLPAASCASGIGQVVWYGTPAPATTHDPGSSDADWVEWTSWVNWYTKAGIGMAGCTGTNYDLDSTRQTLRFRFTLIDPDAINAVPESWRDMLENRLGTMFCQHTFGLHQVIGSGLPSTDRCRSPLIDFGCLSDGVFDWDTTECVFLIGDQDRIYDWGEVPPPSWFLVGWFAPSAQCSMGSEKSGYLTPLAGRSMYIDIPLETADGENSV